MLLEGYEFKKVQKAKHANQRRVEDAEQLFDLSEHAVDDDATDVSALNAKSAP